MRNIFIFIIFQILGLILVNCGKDELSCVPGQREECACGGGESGYQVCDESGDSWGECTGCEADGNETDDSTNTDDSSDVDECEYTSCVGDICEEPEDCCDSSACSSWYYEPEYGFSENYCLPMCDDTASSCKCGDECVDFGDGFVVCLPEGGLSISQKLPVGEDSDSVVFMDVTESDFEAYLGSDEIPVSTLYAYWWEGDTEDDRWMIIRTEGISLSNDFWSIYIYIPASTFESGVGTYPLYDDETEEYFFYIEVLSGNLSINKEITDLWLESVLDNASLEIVATCEPCPVDEEEADCEECEFSIAALFFGMRSKLDY